MAISPPGWNPTAVPTMQGWRDPSTGELLKSQRNVNKLLSEKEEKQRELSTQMTGFRSVPTLGTNPFGR